MKRAARQSAGVEFNPLSAHRREAELEAWICKRLQLRHLFSGTTTTEIRRDRLKAVLLERGLEESVAGKFEGKTITWRELFRRYSGTELA